MIKVCGKNALDQQRRKNKHRIEQEVDMENA